MSEMLDPEIYGFEARDYADWLRGGILTYSGAKRLPSAMRMPDAFPFAQLFIGRNERDLVEDLKDVHQTLPPPARVAFQRGVRLAWTDLEFREEHEFKLAELLLVLACRVRARTVVDSLPGALPWLAAAAAESESRRRMACRVRRCAFQAAVELAASSTESVLCIESFVTDDSFDEPLLERAQALTVVRYLAMNAKDRLPYWCAIFGDAIVADVNEDMIGVKEARALLDEAYGIEGMKRVIDMVRIDKVARLATERGALAETSMNGLYNLVSRIDSARASGSFNRYAVTLSWNSTSHRPEARSADVLQLDEYRASQ